MVTSSATSTLWTMIPAGGECPNVKYQFLYPVDYYDNVACCVYPDGNVSGYTGVTFSCRRSSPGVTYDSYAYFVYPDGVFYRNHVSDDSSGRKSQFTLRRPVTLEAFMRTMWTMMATSHTATMWFGISAVIYFTPSKNKLSLSERLRQRCVLC